MALIVGTPGTVGAGNAFTMVAGDNFILPAGVVAVATAGNGLFSSVGGHTITVMGALYGLNFDGINIGDPNVSSTANITISAGGTVVGADDAIEVHSSNATINNAGLLTGFYGINLFSNNTTGVISIVNSGKIIVEGSGIFQDSQGKVTLTNTGTITSYDGLSYDSQDTATDIIINKGLMSGNITLGGLADTYDGRGGRLVGAVLGGDGIDKLTGGDLVDRMNGGADADILTGGKGKDILSGGFADVAADKFHFNSTLEVGDVISDFTTADFIVIKSSAFGNVAKGALTSAAFHSNTTGLAHDTSDRFIYETDSDRLWYDSNGSASGGVKLMIADIVGDVNFTKGEILVV